MTARRVWIATTLGLVLLAIVVRVALNFSHPYPPGVNAAYYPLQARTWLLHGRLMYDDLPLLFWIHAGVGRTIAAFGVPLDDSLLLATRIVDSVVEPFAAVAVMAFGYVWSDGRLRALPGSLGAAVMVVLSPPIVRMLSDFEKNSVGLVLMAAALWVCRSAMRTPRPQSWTVLGAILLIAGLTHVGAFAFTVILVSAAVAMWLALRGAITLRRGLAILAGAAIAFAGVAATDLHRFERLVRAPVSLFEPRAIEFVPGVVVVLGALLLGISLRLAWRDRRGVDAADIAIVGALATMMIIIGLPKSYVYMDRFTLMAPLPASVLVAFVIARSRRVDVWAGTVFLAASSFAAFMAPESVQRPLMNREVAAELGELKPQIRDADRTLVVAPHGFEWWVGHLLGTKVRSDIPVGAGERYSHVLLMRNTVDCPADVVSPFAAPSIGQGARRLFVGKCVELYEVR